MGWQGNTRVTSEQNLGPSGITGSHFKNQLGATNGATCASWLQIHTQQMPLANDYSLTPNTHTQTL